MLKEAGMVKVNEIVFCDGCGAEITCRPYSVNRWVYCCEDCAFGLACQCGDRMEIEDEHRSPYPEMPG